MHFGNLITRKPRTIYTWYIIHIVFLVLNQQTLGIDPPDNEGKEFILAFSDNKPGKLDDELYITTSKQHHVNVIVSSPRFRNVLLNERFTVIAGEVHIVIVPSDLTVVGFGRSQKGIHVVADDDIIVYGVNLETPSVDAFLCLPLDVLGRKYYAVSYNVATDHNDASQILIVGVEDQTIINLTIPEHVRICDTTRVEDIEQTDLCNTTFTINKFDTFQIQSNSDLTGTLIESSKSIVVFSGNKKTRVGFDGISGDHICQQALPVETWGMEFVVVPIPRRSVGDIVRIIASEDDTTVIKNSNNQTNKRYLNNSGSFLEIDIKSDDYTYFKSDKPILVAQYIKSNFKNDSSDPSMIIVPAVHQFGAMCTFSTPNDLRNRQFEHFFMFVTRKDEVRSLRINGEPLEGETTHQVSDTNFIGGYVVLPKGTYRITQSSPVSLFGGILYGGAKLQSYALPIGLRLPRTDHVCINTTTVEGDGIDNDCDGLIDEEICTDNDEVDDDEDGRVNEDCSRPLPVDGLWTEWEAWSTCNITCTSSAEVRNGTQSRTRSCTNPEPMYDGFLCSGNGTENRDCQAKCSDIPRSCRCPCSKVGGKWNHLLDQNLSNDQLLQALREERERLRKETQIDKKKTAKYIYSKKSNSQDKRSTSKGLSFGLILFISIPVILIVLSDLHNLYTFLRNR